MCTTKSYYVLHSLSRVVVRAFYIIILNLLLKESCATGTADTHTSQQQPSMGISIFSPEVWSSKWSKLIRNLFIYRMPQYIAMNSICSLVDRRYHRLIVKDQPDLCALMSNQSLRSISNDVNVRNILGDDKNIKSEKIMNGPAVSREDNESAGSQPKKVSICRYPMGWSSMRLMANNEMTYRRSFLAGASE